MMFAFHALVRLSPLTVAIFGCRPDPLPVEHAGPEPIAAEVDSVAMNPEGAAPVARGARVSVRFLCDEKYPSDAACDIRVWKRSVAAAPREKDLLDHDSGGPHGAIWNGSAPMVVVAPPSVKEVKVAGVSLEFMDELGMRWFDLPSSVWRRGLHDVEGEPYRAVLVEVDGQPAGEIWQAEGE